MAETAAVAAATIVTGKEIVVAAAVGVGTARVAV